MDVSGAPPILLLNLGHTTVDLMTWRFRREGLSAHSVEDEVPTVALLRRHPYDLLIVFPRDLEFVRVLRESVPLSHQPWVILLGHHQRSHFPPEDLEIIDTYLRFPVFGKDLMVPVRWALNVRPMLRDCDPSDRAQAE